MECLAYYYRDKDGTEIDMLLESDGRLHPIEIKRTSSPSPGLSRSFRALDAGSVPCGMGAILCTKECLSAIDKTTLIVPIWMI